MSWILRVSNDGSLIQKVIFRPKMTYDWPMETGSFLNYTLERRRFKVCNLCASRKFNLFFPRELMHFDPQAIACDTFSSNQKNTFELGGTTKLFY